MNSEIRLILVIAGLVLFVVGFFIKNWQVAVAGNSVAIVALLFA